MEYGRGYLCSRALQQPVQHHHLACGLFERDRQARKIQHIYNNKSDLIASSNSVLSSDKPGLVGFRCVILYHVGINFQIYPFPRVLAMEFL